MDGDYRALIEHQPVDGFGLRNRPTNLRAEMSILGGIMMSEKMLAHVSEFLKPQHFADPVNAKIYSEQLRRINAGGIADALALKTWFEAEPLSAEVSGIAYLGDLMTSFVGPGTMGPYAHAVIAAWRRRQILDAAESLAAGAFDNDGDPSSLIASTVRRLEETISDDDRKQAMSLDEAMDAALSASDAARNGTGPHALSTGFRCVDEFLGGLEPGTLNVLAGRPGMGKSALGHQMALAAARQGVGVLEISLEMTGKELGRRALSSAANVPVGFIKSGRLTAWQGEALVKARREMRGLPLMIEDGSGLSVSQIATAIRQAQRRHKLGLIMIDHLHIVRPEDSDVRQGATWAVGRISGAMKRLAKEHDCPILLLAQLNRGVEGRDDKRPGLSDLRQAGDIEQDADVVSFVYRPEYYLGKGDPERTESESPDRHQKRIDDYRDRKALVAGKAELIFSKVRDGAVGTVNLTFNGATTSFSEEDNG